MIISASRRTDIPAFYGNWFTNRLRAGFAEVVNPFNLSQVRKIDLRPEVVDAIVFWTRNAKPLIPRLDEFDRRGYKYYFLYTITGYPKEFEPNLPPVETAIDTFQKLAEIIGPERVIWRYDPIVLSTLTDRVFHQRNFEAIAGKLAGATGLVIISFLDFYRKTERRIRELSEAQLITFEKLDPKDEIDLEFTGEMRRIAKLYGMAIQTCAEGHNISIYGIPPGQCIDYGLINSFGGLRLARRKDPSQREKCLCGISVDIGAYNTCGYRCAYCYANASFENAAEHLKTHDPELPSLSPYIPIQGQ